EAQRTTDRANRPPPVSRLRWPAARLRPRRRTSVHAAVLRRAARGPPAARPRLRIAPGWSSLHPIPKTRALLRRGAERVADRGGPHLRARTRHREDQAAGVLVDRRLLARLPRRALRLRPRAKHRFAHLR